ncbi:MAG: hypothetical protein LBC84_05190, partial [Prevotellaceae bacterium]|nr:hypothetical protein [Prevotellaceae bacterium]
MTIKYHPTAKNTVALFLATLSIFWSCSQELSDPHRPKEKSVVFVVRISVPDIPISKTIPDSGLDDNQVDEITILLFNPTTGAYMGFAQTSAIEQVVGISNINKKRFSLLIPDGSYHALLIANATPIISATCDLPNGLLSAGGAITKSNIENALRFQIAAGTKYNANPGSNGYNPFFLCSDWIDLDIPVPSTIDYEMDPIKLTRMVAKINVYNNVGVEFEMSEIHLCNYNLDAYLSPAWGWWTHPAPLFASSGVTRPTTLESGLNKAIVYSGTELQPNNHCVDEIFTFEAPVTDPSTQNLCLLVKVLHVTINGVVYSNRWYKLDFRMKDENDNHVVKSINILRNFSYNLFIKDVKNPGYPSAVEAYANEPEGLIIDLVATDEPGLNEIVFNGTCYLAVDRSYIYFYHDGGTDLIKVFTDYTGGWEIKNITYGAGGTGWISPTPHPIKTSAPNIHSSTPVTLSVLPNNGTKPRTATFTLFAGTLKKEVTIVQFPKANLVTDDFPPNVNKYVGAFWRSNQTGERLIRIERPTSGASIDGEWTAVVLEGMEWIVLDTVMTTDKNVGWRNNGTLEGLVHNGNDPNFDVTHPVKSVTTMVTGTLRDPSAPGYRTGEEVIYFRIGAKTTYLPTEQNPARYGVVLLLCKENQYACRIWIRQGHDPDYLMRKEDGINVPGTGGLVNPNGPNARPNAVKFSPYNLNDPTENLSTTLITVGVPNVGLPIGGGEEKFVSYPSQAGYMIRWNYSRQPFAPHLTGPIVGWDLTQPGITTWDPSLTETCPTKYRRPNDGGDPNPNGYVLGSEVRQSLYSTPKTNSTSDADTRENSVWGYYADGFFDRRLISSSPGTGANASKSAVSTSNNKVAYMGRLFFNSKTFANLFLPASGARNFNGSLTDAGNGGFYWLRSSIDNLFAWSLHLTDNGVFQLSTSNRCFGFPVRCVVDPCVAVAGILIQASSSTLPVGATVTLTATNLYPSFVTNVTYIWEVNSGAGWLPLSTTTTNTYQAPVLNVGVNANHYRVGATNSCNATPVFSATTVSGTQTTPVPTGGGAARVTWEWPSVAFPTGRYIITYEPRDAGLYFKHGSVVGIFSGDDAKNKNLMPPASAITTTFTASKDIPWTLSPIANWVGIPYNNTLATIDAGYHTVANVKQGKGDPCRLVGLDLNYIKTTAAGSLTYDDIDNQLWRMPTGAENSTFSDRTTSSFFNLHWWNRDVGNPVNPSPYYGVAGGEFPVRNSP